jgi:hypothetical protein
VPANLADVEDRVYGADLDDFVNERAAAAKELRADGRREDAAAAAKLPKPSVAAWIVNRLARQEANRMGELLDAGASLREIQIGAGSAADLRAAGEAQEAALRALMRAGEGVAASRGSANPATLDRVRETLHAAALDADIAEVVRRGVLVREQRAVGFPMALAIPEDRRRPAAAKPAAKPASQPRRSEPRAEPRDEVAAKRRERAATVAEEAQAALLAAESDLEAAHEELGDAEADLEQAQAALAAAEQRAKDARRAVTTAEKTHAKATKDAEHALGRLRELDG